MTVKMTGRAALLLTLIAAPPGVQADGGERDRRRTRVLHEPPPGGAQNARNDRLVPAKGGRKDRLPAAIDTASGRIQRPSAARPDGPPPPMYAAPAKGATRSDRVRADRRTGGEHDLRYGVVFDPSVMPFKRDQIFDRVAADGALERSGVGQRPMTPRGDDLRPGHELFWGRVAVELAASQPTPLPSVSVNSELIQWQSSPPLSLKFSRDRAGNWSVTSSRGASAVLRLLVDAPSTYFAAPLGDGPTSDDPWRPVLPAPMQTQMQALWPALDVHPSQHSRGHNLRQLASWYRGFEAGDVADGKANEVLADLTVARRGVCRHRSMAFVAMAHSLGIPAQYVINDAHAFVEAWAVGSNGKGGWQRIDLGGSADTLRLQSAENKHLHQPLYRDPMPRPDAFDKAITRVEDGQGLDATSWAGARKVRGANKMVGAARGQGPAQGQQSPDPSKQVAARKRDSPQGRAWLRRRAMSVAARRSPPPAASARAQAAIPGDGRLPTAVKLAPQAGLVYVGETIKVGGTLRAEGAQRLAELPVEIWLVDVRRPTEGVQIGTAMTDAKGRFTVGVHIPLDTKLGLFDLVARFPGTARLAPDFSTSKAPAP